MIELLEKIRADQTDRWRSGERVPAEAYLEQHARLRDHAEAAVDLIYSEILVRERLGELVNLDEYRRRFPQYAELLGRQMELHELLRPELLADDSDELPTAPYRLAARPDDPQRTLGLEKGAGSDRAGWPSIPGYTIMARLGGGGGGVVYLAEDRNLRRAVAIKLLHRTEPEEQALFRREAEAVARLKHPHVVPIYGFGEYEGRPYFVMEYAEGGGLDGRVRGRPLPPREAAALVATLAGAVEAVHRHQIVHRDLKPANVLLGADGVPKIADFGLAKRLTDEGSLFRTGTVIGTPAYMAPEQAAGNSKEVGRAADVYALGGILYEALTGRPPFQGSELLTVLEWVRSRPPVPPSRLRPTPRPLEIICLKCLEKEPGRRYASAQELGDDLHAYLEGRPIKAKPERWPERLLRFVKKRPVAVVAPVVLAAVVAVTWSLAGYHPTPATVPAADPVQQIQDQLAGTGRYTFIGEGGPPAWYRWRTVGGEIIEPTNQREGFTYKSYTLCLLEVLPEVRQEHFIFKARVQHRQVLRNDDVGIYVACKSRSAVGADVLGFCALTFNDCQNSRPAVQPGEPTGNPVGLQIRFFRDLPAVNRTLNPGPVSYFKPACRPADQNPWRELALEVTPTKVRVFWDGSEVGEITPGELTKHARQLQLIDSQILNLDVDFYPKGGLGLFVEQGSASFKDVVIETSFDNR
jgi:Protein kinase domain